jgi:guanylate kinase
MERSIDYDFIVVNDDLARASDELRSIVVACRCRRQDNLERLGKIFDTFGGN